jgi:two-component system response regulator QseB
MRILIVEDDALLGDGLASGLRALGFAVDWFRDGAAADQALAMNCSMSFRDSSPVRCR